MFYNFTTCKKKILLQSINYISSKHSSIRKKNQFLILSWFDLIWLKKKKRVKSIHFNKFSFISISIKKKLLPDLKKESLKKSSWKNKKSYQNRITREKSTPRYTSPETSPLFYFTFTRARAHTRTKKKEKHVYVYTGGTWRPVSFMPLGAVLLSASKRNHYEFH